MHLIVWKMQTIVALLVIFLGGLYCWLVVVGFFKLVVIVIISEEPGFQHSFLIWSLCSPLIRTNEACHIGRSECAENAFQYAPASLFSTPGTGTNQTGKSGICTTFLWETWLLVADWRIWRHPLSSALSPGERVHFLPHVSVFVDVYAL